MSSSPVPLKTLRVGQRCTLNLSRVETSSRWCCVECCQVIYSQFGLAIHPNDHQARRRFVEWAQNEIAVVPDFHKRILFSDEAHFWLNGYVNKQNCRIWSEANPQVYVETPLHPEKLTVWCALWAGGIIGPYFFKNDEGHTVTVNGDRYRAMITNFFIPELNNHDVQELWFLQDGATCNTARATIDLLKDTFGDHLISRFGPGNRPPRSCDLTSLDYFLWGCVKSLVYADKPQTLDHLEDNIRRVIADIWPQMLEKAIENWTSRLDYIRASRVSPMPEIIFKICFSLSTFPLQSPSGPKTVLICPEQDLKGPLTFNDFLPTWAPKTLEPRIIDTTDTAVATPLSTRMRIQLEYLDRSSNVGAQREKTTFFESKCSRKLQREFSSLFLPASSSPSGNGFGPGEGTVAGAGSEASRVRTGQWGSPIGSWVFVNFCVHEVCERMGDIV
ncbi:transposase [Trichonephila clavipes]|nr:transposase [Trichonephila clavipes]